MKPFIEINNRHIEVSTPHYTLRIEFPAYVDPAAVALRGEGFEKAKHVAHEKVTEIPTPAKEHGIRKTKEPDFNDYMNAPIRKYNDKVCKSCGKSYSPNGPSQVYCADSCNPKKHKTLSDMQEQELEKTLAEIEERRKKPYFD